MLVTFHCNGKEWYLVFQHIWNNIKLLDKLSNKQFDLVVRTTYTKRMRRIKQAKCKNVADFIQSFFKCTALVLCRCFPLKHVGVFYEIRVTPQQSIIVLLYFQTSNTSVPLHEIHIFRWVWHVVIKSNALRISDLLVLWRTFKVNFILL